VKLELPARKLAAEIDGSVAWPIYNNPERRNALSFEMQRAIPAILERFENDPAIRVVVVRAAGGPPSASRSALEPARNAERPRVPGTSIRAG